MAFANALDPLTPAGTDEARFGDDNIRLKTAAIRERVNSFFVDVDADPWVIKAGSRAAAGFIVGASDPGGTEALRVNGAGRFMGAVTLVNGSHASTRAGAGDTAFEAAVTGDTNNRFVVSAAGKIFWGPGNAALDATLERTAVGQLQLNSKLIVGTADPGGSENLRVNGGIRASSNIVAVAGSAAIEESTDTLHVRLQSYSLKTLYINEIGNRVHILAGGSQDMIVGIDPGGAEFVRIGGSFRVLGATTLVTTLSLGGIATLQAGASVSGGDIRVTRALASDFAFGALVSGDSAFRLYIRADGSMGWGPGNAAPDVSVVREAAGTLRVGDKLVVGASDPGGTENLRVSGSARVAGDVLATGALFLNGALILSGNATYGILHDPEGASRIYVGDTGDPTNVYDNTNHQWRSRDGLTIFAQLASAGLSIGTDPGGSELVRAASARFGATTLANNSSAYPNLSGFEVTLADTETAEIASNNYRGIVFITRTGAGVANVAIVGAQLAAGNPATSVIYSSGSFTSTWGNAGTTNVGYSAAGQPLRIQNLSGGSRTFRVQFICGTT